MNPRAQAPLGKTRLGKTGLEVTRLGFGCTSLGNLYRPIDDATARATATAAWEQGLRYFDTAPYYGFGLSERRLGDVLRAYPNEYVLSTKVGRLLVPCARAEDKYGFCSPLPFEPVYDYSYDGVMRSFEDSLQRLGLSRIDIIYMHDIGQVTHGKRHKELFAIAMDGGYKAMHQKKGISIVIGGPYNSGILAAGTKSNQTLTYNYESAPPDIIKKVQRIEQCCERYKVPLAAAALQFPLAHPVVASVIPGLGNPERVTKTVELMQTKIPAALWQELKANGLVHPQAPLPGAA
jgi:D-threo-aldose 1-dehydrogenase